MREDPHSNIFIAPLHIRKPGELARDHLAEAPMNRGGTSRPVQHAASVMAEEMASARPRFQNYLRALYPFQPPAAHTTTTVTLPLRAGDIVLVHSVHVNGWADGTLLDTGARGWLPTNYCEPYDYAAMRPLLRALTEFWDMVRHGGDSNLGLFHSQDYMKPMVAGVRFLLEKSECLTRDATLVKRHEGIRRSRKFLLADLALLVKAAKQLQQKVAALTVPNDLDIRLDDMLLKAFRILTRAVTFFDVWSEETTLLGTYPGARITDSPRDDGPGHLGAAPLSPVSLGPDSTHSYEGNSIRSTPAGSAAPSKRTSCASSAVSPASITPSSRRMSVMHRLSYNGGAGHPPQNPKLASEFLHRSYDDFLTVLASFLGSHMQSRSSSELLLTTQSSVKACRQLIAVIEIVIDRDDMPSRPLLLAKESMYDAITELVHAARQVFKPVQSFDDDLVYLPEEGHNLIQAATACVSAAGRCIARTKAALEDLGDFELDEDGPRKKRSSDDSHTVGHLAFQDQPAQVVSPVQPTAPFENESSDRKARPHLDTTPAMLTPSLSSNRSDSPSSTMYGSVPPTPADDVIVDIIHSSPLPTTSPDRESQSESHEYSTSLHLTRQKSGAATVVPRMRSDSRFRSRDRLSDPSDLSTASTGATSFQEGGGGGLHSHHFAPPSDKLHPAGSTTAAEEEDDAESEMLERTFAHELIFNREGQVAAGTLNALIERLTAHDSTPDVLFVTTIYLTFRLFAKPQEFAQALAFRFQYVGDNARIANPVRLRVYNVLKGWLESHWRHDCDDVALPLIVDFAKDTVMPVLPMAGQRLLDLAEKVRTTHAAAIPRVISSIGKTSTSSAAYVPPDSPLPAPVISKSQLAALKNWKTGGGAPINILDFDPLELARQMTLKTSEIFCSILPEELLAGEWSKQSSSLAVNVRALSTLATDLSNLVAESILQLEEPKRRAALIKHWIKIANKCLELDNYDTLIAIICPLDSTNIKRLRRTWDVVPTKAKTTLAELKKVIVYEHNYAALRERLQGRVPPCLPFIGMYLTDLTMADAGIPGTRQLTTETGTISVINLYKHMRTATSISDLQRFQIPYRLVEVPELQTWMQDQLIRVRSTSIESFQNHYRRSLILEPKEVTHSTTPGEGSTPLEEKDRFDFLSKWAHILKEKPVPVPN